MTPTAESATTDHIFQLVPELLHPDKPQTKLPTASRIYVTIRVAEEAPSQAVKDEVRIALRGLGEYLQNDTSSEFKQIVDTYAQAILTNRSEGEQ